ncbi:MAG TPA: hypothetical protein VFE60_19975 [Roseiarcus sp.]|nr:hypothetical protein [Roseiarcus sp.]
MSSKTFSTVKQVEAMTVPGRYRDETTPGLYISVTIGKTRISKSYVWRGRVGGGREREVGLGSASKAAQARHHHVLAPWLPVQLPRFRR